MATGSCVTCCSVSIAPLWNWKMLAAHLTSWWRQGFNRTFMELKARRARVPAVREIVSIAPLWNWKMLKTQVSTNKMRFQSHLYGIESEVKCAHLASNRSFNRTFMELKEASVRESVSAASRFNRTFMELKENAHFFWFCGLAFQSHLYGIERRMDPLHGWRSTVFQSHLYGIERKISPPWALLYWPVSIAPLWNWKTKSGSFSTRASSTFQSHLYGIERKGAIFT